ncbi:MAG: hypothetical protein ABW160_16890 [Candidatus Thiodiazotropha sp. 4PDIV1]
MKLSNEMGLERFTFSINFVIGSSIFCSEEKDSGAIIDCSLAERRYHCNHMPIKGGEVMANLVVRNLDQMIVDALKLRAARHGRSAEAEHRALLEETLLRPKRKSFAEVLRSMPNVGQDDDFARVEDEAGNERVFD